MHCLRETEAIYRLETIADRKSIDSSMCMHILAKMFENVGKVWASPHVIKQKKNEKK